MRPQSCSSSVTGPLRASSTRQPLASLVVGYPVAYFMVRYAGRWNGLIVFLLIAPLLT
jgi:ABC-type spermidine/putrescine transport system permease subunit I